MAPLFLLSLAGWSIGEWKPLYGGVRVKCLSLAGKLGLVLLWLGILIVCSAPLAKPFASLLALVAVLILLVNLVNFVQFGAQSQGRRPWSERLQLLLFGAFHWPAHILESATVKEGLPVALSETQARGGQTDQQHAD